MTPLREMGAAISARDGRFPPLEIHGGTLRAIDYTLPVASAQVKSCILFAGLFCDGRPRFVNRSAPVTIRELALREFGADVTIRKGVISVEGKPTLKGRELLVPGDLSSAAFFLVAAMIVPDSELILQAVGLNPTRAALIDFLVSIGAGIARHQYGADRRRADRQSECPDWTDPRRRH